MSQLGTAVVLTAFLASCWPMSEPDAWEHNHASCDLRGSTEWPTRCIYYNMDMEISAEVFGRIEADCRADGGTASRDDLCPSEGAAVCQINHGQYGLPGIAKEYEYDPAPELEQECVEAGNWYWPPM